MNRMLFLTPPNYWIISKNTRLFELNYFYTPQFYVEFLDDFFAEFSGVYRFGRHYVHDYTRRVTLPPF